MSAKVDEATGKIPDDDSTVEKFDLESPQPGHVPDRVIEELCRCYREAADYTAALAEALKAQAEKHDIEPKALRMYISALCSDKKDQTKKVADDLALLLEDAGD